MTRSAPAPKQHNPTQVSSKDWSNLHHKLVHLRSVQTSNIASQIQLEDWRKTYSPMTKFSEEHVTIVQLHGSTASPSQLSRTPCGSSREYFMPIKACTALRERDQIQIFAYWKDMKLWTSRKKEQSFKLTFKVHSLRRKQSIRWAPKQEGCETEKSYSSWSPHIQLKFSKNKMQVHFTWGFSNCKCKSTKMLIWNVNSPQMGVVSSLWCSK